MKKEKNNLWEIVGIAWELGYIIAIPLVGLALIGRLADKSFGSSPLFLLTGILLAIVLSTILVSKKTMELLRKAEEEDTHDNNNEGGSQ